MSCPFGGEICEASCCNGTCSSGGYRVVVVVAVSFNVALMVLFSLLEGDGGGLEQIVYLVGFILFVFFVSDCVIQWCILKGSKARCVCCPDCAYLLPVNLGVTTFGVTVSFIEIGAWFIASHGADITVVRFLRLLVFAKLAMEISLVCIYFGCCGCPPYVKDAPASATAPPSNDPQVIVGRPVQIDVVGKATDGQPVKNPNEKF